MKTRKRKKSHQIGLTVTGGERRVSLLVGMLPVLMQQLDVSYISAVSAGGIVAAKMLELWPNLDKFERIMLDTFKTPPFSFNLNVLRRFFASKSLYNNDVLKNIISELDIKKICMSPCQLDIICTNFLTREKKVFSNHSSSPSIFKKALLASTAFPMLFRPVEIEGGIFIDGGMVSPLPADTARLSGCKCLIGIDTDPRKDIISLKDYKKMGLLEILMRGYGILARELTQKMEEKCDYNIYPHSSFFSSGMGWGKKDILKMQQAILEGKKIGKQFLKEELGMTLE